MLPRYPSDRVLFMEFLKQAQHVHSFLHHRHKIAVPFPFIWGIFSYKIAADCKYMMCELERYNFKYYIKRRSYDPLGHYAARLE